MCEARDLWASLSMPGRLFCKDWKSVLFTCWVLALKQGTSQVKKHLPKSATSSRSNSENSRDKCVNDSEWLMLSQMEQLFMNVNVHIKLFVCGYDIQTPQACRYYNSTVWQFDIQTVPPWWATGRQQTPRELRGRTWIPSSPLSPAGVKSAPPGPGASLVLWVSLMPALLHGTVTEQALRGWQLPVYALQL